MENPVILDEQLNNSTPKIARRRKLIPVWMKIFVWLFMVMGLFVLIGFIFGLLKMRFEMALYGITTNEPFSSWGILLMLLFLVKGIVAFALWTEHDWAVDLGIFDAVIGILICLFGMIGYPALFAPDAKFQFRFELVFLIPYLIKLLKMRLPWHETKV
ncbi:MAG: hypothetical protein ABIS36_22785 [Chryseolinea sp.]